MRFVLPGDYRQKALKACHDDMGHLGQDWSLDLLKDRFFWPNMANDIENHIRKCDRCLHFKVKTQRAEMKPILAS